MRQFICLLLSVGFFFAATGCASKKEQSDWEQCRAQKAQEELSKEAQ